MNSNRGSKQKERKERKRKRFIKNIINSAILNIRKMEEDTGNSAIILPPYSEREWMMIKENLDEINRILDKYDIKIEIEYPQLEPYEIRIVKLL